MWTRYVEALQRDSEDAAAAVDRVVMVCCAYLPGLAVCLFVGPLRPGAIAATFTIGLLALAIEAHRGPDIALSTSAQRHAIDIVLLACSLTALGSAWFHGTVPFLPWLVCGMAAYANAKPRDVVAYHSLYGVVRHWKRRRGAMMLPRRSEDAIPLGPWLCAMAVCCSALVAWQQPTAAAWCAVTAAACAWENACGDMLEYACMYEQQTWCLFVCAAHTWAFSSPTTLGMTVAMAVQVFAKYTFTKQGDDDWLAATVACLALLPYHAYQSRFL